MKKYDFGSWWSHPSAIYIQQLRTSVIKLIQSIYFGVIASPFRREPLFFARICAREAARQLCSYFWEYIVNILSKISKKSYDLSNSTVLNMKHSVWNLRQPSFYKSNIQGDPIMREKLLS